MAIPALFTTLSRFGYGVAKKIRPSKVKKALKPVVSKATKPALQGTKMAGAETALIKGVKGAASKGFKGYRSLYGGTLGTSTRRKVTSGTIGGALGLDLIDDD